MLLFTNIRSNRQIPDHLSDSDNPKYRSVKDLPSDNQAIRIPENTVQACAFRSKIKQYHHKDLA